MPTLTHSPAVTTVVTRPSPSPTASTPDPSGRTLAEAVALASATVLEVDLADPRWEQVGPRLTAFVDAARRALDGSGSRIGAGEGAPPVLRLRDLGRLAQISAATQATQPAEVTRRLRSLQIATLQ